MGAGLAGRSEGCKLQSERSAISFQQVGLEEEFEEFFWVAGFEQGFFSGDDVSPYEVGKRLVQGLLPFQGTVLQIGGYFVCLAFADEFPYPGRGGHYLEGGYSASPDSGRQGLREHCLYYL